MNNLLKNKPFIISATVFALIIGGLIISYFSSLYVLSNLSFKEVTPTQLAAAMRQDEFWSSYRLNTLVFNGKVQSITKNSGKTTLGFVTSDAYSASCEITNSNVSFKIGNTYKFEAETYQAERQPQGVLLHNCLNQ